MRWLMRKAGLEERLERLEKGFIELDSVCIVNGEDIEELRAEITALGDTISTLAKPTPQPASSQGLLGEMLNEYLYGYQNRSREGNQ